MPTYRVSLPAATDPARVDAFLAAHGYTVLDGSSLGSGGMVSVTVDRDPSADLATYSDAPTTQQQAVLTAISYLKTWLPIARADPAPSPDRKALLAITVILKAQLTP